MTFLFLWVAKKDIGWSQTQKLQHHHSPIRFSNERRVTELKKKLLHNSYVLLEVQSLVCKYINWNYNTFNVRDVHKSGVSNTNQTMRNWINLLH